MKTTDSCRNLSFSGGRCGIRTHVPAKANGFQDRLVMTTSITFRLCLTQNEFNKQYLIMRLRLVMSCCGARKDHRIRRCSVFSTAATPFCSLDLPQAALANVPTSITFRLCLTQNEFNKQYLIMRLRLVMSCCGARKDHRIRRCSVFSTAATPFCSLDLPQAALANVPTSITFRMHRITVR